MDTCRTGIIFFTIYMVGMLAIPSLVHMHIVYPSLAAGALYSEFEDGTMIFVGDIMLGRAVERISKKEGRMYPFEGMGRFLQSADVTIGNFEGSIPDIHTPTPNGSLRFSIEEEFMGPLQEVGFDVFSLANNHAYDFGDDGLTHTREVCAAYEFACVGDPRDVEGGGAATVAIGSTRIAVVGVHAVFLLPSLSEIEDRLREVEGNSDMQIVYIHWGEEYANTHSDQQQALAHALIDMGFDAVIGHHPHVVQDIEVYEGRPIFYSLGNFIFDQYFSEEVQQGLVVMFTSTRDTFVYTLVPISSIGTKSQPHIMNVEHQQVFLSELFERSTTTKPYVVGNSLIIAK